MPTPLSGTRCVSASSRSATHPRSTSAWRTSRSGFEAGIALLPRVYLGITPQFLTGLADTLLAAGEVRRAWIAPDEVAAIAERVGVRPQEAMARITRARVRLVNGIEAHGDVDADLTHAAALMSETGAHVCTPFLHVARA
jgi:hypothetical protein